MSRVRAICIYIYTYVCVRLRPPTVRLRQMFRRRRTIISILPRRLAHTSVLHVFVRANNALQYLHILSDDIMRVFTAGSNTHCTRFVLLSFCFPDRLRSSTIARPRIQIMHTRGVFHIYLTNSANVYFTRYGVVLHVHIAHIYYCTYGLESGKT